MSFGVDWRSSISSRSQRHDLVEDRGVLLGLGRWASTACVSNDARDWTHFVLVYVHVLRSVGGWGALACFSICCRCPQFCWVWGTPLLDSVVSVLRPRRPVVSVRVDVAVRVVVGWGAWATAGLPSSMVCGAVRSRTTCVCVWVVECCGSVSWQRCLCVGSGVLRECVWVVECCGSVCG